MIDIKLQAECVKQFGQKKWTTTGAVTYVMHINNTTA